ncbi:MAG: hypothetical protein KDD41_09160 [Flavobacteriales bacterium]|nr:hypothetical protein [Flavobacteriales bacterium]
MKKLLIVLLSIVFLSSCVTIEFENPQPKKGKLLQAYPEDLRGTYRIKMLEKDAEISSDTLLIAETYYENKDTKRQRMFLSDSCQLYTYQSDYIINIKVRSEVAWTVGLIRKESNGNLTVYGLFDQDENKEKLLNDVGAITTINRVPKPNGGHSFVINPKPKEFNLIVDKGYFKPVYELIPIKE